MSPSLTLSQFIASSPEEVYDFVRDPLNFPLWLSFVTEVSPEAQNGEWLLQTAGGVMALRFVPNNPFGVLDHQVRLESGLKVINPMRVMPNGEGSEVLFTLFQSEGMSEAQFREDAATVERDLALLKQALEQC